VTARATASASALAGRRTPDKSHLLPAYGTLKTCGDGFPFRGKMRKILNRGQVEQAAST